MGLRMRLEKENNHMYCDFDAYWAVDQLHYDTEFTYFRLNAYPSREAHHVHLQPIEQTSIGIGGAIFPSYDPILYTWDGAFRTSDVFPNGIPISEDEQKTVVYMKIKEYTNLPFEDVFED